jgi:hypothetical protein
MDVKITVLWDVEPCRAIVLMMEVVRLSETSVFYEIPLRDVAEGSHLHTCEI